ncbi:MAG TPA: peptide chain release factor 2 [Aestuariivirga sp.]|nr:peptide chain release factor 2 [Hyphomicrobiales bacterium]MBP9175207.1 peptide chain release factor 2 [Hyphomicrobiales bacterium]MCC7481210.1 peptide chain release factor 2 [Hyphomicrobiales bacterium]HQY72434.1 peptide chain release factor 2 [Aestuariivirga sp.]HRA93700.1 peptide chain release factor 2 [Aestuariivirga sp.]
MRAETVKVVEEMKQSIGLLRRHLDWDSAIRQLAELNARSEDPNLWNDPQKAQEVMRKRQDLDARISSVLRLEQTIEDNVGLIELGELEGDHAIVSEAEKSLTKLQLEVAEQELETLLSGEADGNDSYLQINAGAGGTESQDWASMLMRMYTRWANQNKFKVSVLDEHAGEEAGIKSCTLEIKGHNAYGKLKTESGVHRLVRISPYDSNARRHTSFASVWAYPVIDDNIDIQVNESECKIDTYRASGAGGQHVNTTDSAVRITHLPTGIVVACQAERSQHKNRATAWKMLKARLYERELQMQQEKIDAVNAKKTDIGWGHQIRSYVLQPYQLVKDLRTGYTSTNPAAVLDGGLDDFIQASLAKRVQGLDSEVIEDID